MSKMNAIGFEFWYLRDIEVFSDLLQKRGRTKIVGVFLQDVTGGLARLIWFWCYYQGLEILGISYTHFDFFSSVVTRHVLMSQLDGNLLITIWLHLFWRPSPCHWKRRSLRRLPSLNRSEDPPRPPRNRVLPIPRREPDQSLRLRRWESHWPHQRCELFCLISSQIVFQSLRSAFWGQDRTNLSKESGLRPFRWFAKGQSDPLLPFYLRMSPLLTYPLFQPSL